MRNNISNSPLPTGRQAHPPLIKGGIEGATNASPISDSWVDLRIDDIHNEIDKNKKERGHKNGCLNHRIIPIIDGIHSQSPHPRPAEIVSVITAPLSIIPNCKATMVIMGMRAFFQPMFENHLENSCNPLLRAVRIKSLSKTSSILERVRRVWAAVENRARVIAGIIRFSIPLSLDRGTNEASHSEEKNKHNPNPENGC